MVKMFELIVTLGVVRPFVGNHRASGRNSQIRWRFRREVVENGTALLMKALGHVNDYGQVPPEVGFGFDKLLLAEGGVEITQGDLLFGVHSRVNVPQKYRSAKAGKFGGTALIAAKFSLLYRTA
jgi:hypothetical protein